ITLKMSRFTFERCFATFAMFSFVVVISLHILGGFVMLVFNPRRIFALRGIEKPAPVLSRQGIAPSTALKFLRTDGLNFKVKYVEMICVTQNCTPNDLFDWVPDKQTTLAENHPLKALQRTEKIASIRELLHDLPVE